MRYEITDEDLRRTLKNQQEFLTAVLEGVEDGIVACNAEGVLTLFNRAAREFHGVAEGAVPPDQWAGYYDLYLPDGRTRMGREEVPLFRALGGEHVRDVEMVIAPKGGKARTLLASGRPLLGPDGERLGAVVIMHDITEGKQAQDALRRESRLMQALMDNIPDAIYFKDTQGRFTRVNRHAPYRVDAPPEEVIGKTDFDFFVEEHARAAYEDEQRIIRTGRPVIDKVEKETYPDGSITWLSTTKVPTFDEEGRVTGIVGISRDITERVRAEEERIALIHEQAARAEAEAANRMKDEFLATLSHELRTPLTPILGWVQVLRGGMADRPEAEVNHALEAILRNALAQARLVDDLLDVSRIISGKLHLDARPVELSEVIASAVEAARRDADAKGVRIERLAAPAATAPVSGDRDRLRQVFCNLLSNAVKFTPPGGRVEVRVGRAGPNVEVVVSDTGRGIAPEFLPHVFERFRQADQSTTRRHGGLGLGLSIVRQMVELHGGEVRAASSGEGLGSTFTVSLPAATGRAEPDAGPARRALQSDEPLPSAGRTEELKAVRVLVVDDEADTRGMLMAVLADSGAWVWAAGSTAEALELLERARPDVLICDIGMPGEDGYDLIRKVRALPAERGGRTPAVALTAYAREEDRVEALRSGFQKHVSKPIEPGRLVTVVSGLMSESGEAAST